MTDLPFPGSQCHRCRYVRLTGNTRGSMFIQCQHPELRKYRSQPVHGCTGFMQRGEASDCDSSDPRDSARGAEPASGEPDSDS